MKDNIIEQAKEEGLKEIKRIENLNGGDKDGCFSNKTIVHMGLNNALQFQKEYYEKEKERHQAHNHLLSKTIIEGVKQHEKEKEEIFEEIKKISKGRKHKSNNGKYEYQEIRMSKNKFDKIEDKAFSKEDYCKCPHCNDCRKCPEDCHGSKEKNEHKDYCIESNIDKEYPECICEEEK